MTVFGKYVTVCVWREEFNKVEFFHLFTWNIIVIFNYYITINLLCQHKYHNGMTDYEKFLKKLGNKIRYYRRDKDFSQAQVAEMLGKEETYLSEIERGKRNITLKTLYSIITVLKINPSKLFDFSD